jgi:hypothetical protein
MKAELIRKMSLETKIRGKKSTEEKLIEKRLPRREAP